jgi:hypothetical protein
MYINYDFVIYFFITKPIKQLYNIKINKLSMYNTFIEKKENYLEKYYYINSINIKKLAPRPDNYCYCGKNRNECLNYIKLKRDCNGFNNISKIFFNY